MEFKSKPRFLLVRTDKIGDVILTTPAITSLRKKYPDAYIAYLCRSYTAPVLLNNPALNLIIKGDEYPFIGLAANIIEHRFDAAIHFYVEPRSALASFISRIPVRIGPFSKWPALFLNHRLQQNRSRVEKHEAEYNLDLVKECGASGESTPPAIFLTDGEKLRGGEIILSILGQQKKPVLIHPGSAGSVQNWPLEHFLELSRKIADAEDVIFTAGQGEEMLIEKVKNLSHQRIRLIPAGSLSLRELAGVISQSKCVISNSTGPLHIASALAIPTLSFYPHLPAVTSAKRWGPFGNSKRNIILSPKNPSDPMSSISVEKAFESLKRIS